MVKYLKRKTLLFMLAIMLSNTACSNMNDKTSSYEYEEDVYLKRELTEEELRQIKIDNFRSFFMNFEPTYKNEKYLITDKEIEKIINDNKNNEQCHFEWNGSIDDLMNIIENNSTKYVKQHPEYKNYFDLYDESTSFDDKMIFMYAFSSTINSFFEHSSNDINEDIHRMQTLKIVVDNSENKDEDNILGSYDELENLIIININNNISLVSKDQEDYVSDIEKILKKTLEHELNHTRQKKCECFNMSNDNLNLDNPDYVSFLVESSAESAIYNLDEYSETDNLYYTYIEERKAESLLFLMNITEDKDINEYYNAIFDSDMTAFCHFFNANNDQQIKDLYKIIYIMDAKFGRNDFIDKYYNKNIPEELTYNDIKKLVGFPERTEIFRISLLNLLNYSENNNSFSLKDHLIIFSIIKNVIILDINIFDDNESDNMIYPGESKKYDSLFSNEIITLENKYREYLCYKYNISNQEIDDMTIGIQSYLLDVGNFISNDFDQCNSNIIEIKQLFERFPLLKPILFSDRYNSYDYDIFLDNLSLESKQLIKK